jgi:hypothetical protein
MGEQPEVHNIEEPSQEEVQQELGMGGDDDALGMETKIIEKVVGHDG